MRSVGVLVMAYGSASDPDDIERYYTDIRGGRPPSLEHLEELKERYAAIGDRFSLLDITREQAQGLERELDAGDPDSFKVYLGMKHSPPFIADGVAEMARDGIERAVGIVMAPHWSGMSIETYVQRVEAATAGRGPTFTYVKSFHDHPLFVDLLAARVSDALAKLPPEERSGSAVIFSAHSLPVRTLGDGTQRCLRCSACEDSCRYRDGLQETADLVAGKLGLGASTIAWQSAGRTADPWWGPPLEDVIVGLGAEGYAAVVVCSAGFVSDHLEILYDIDLEAKRVAEEAGMRLVRTEMPNADPAFVRMLAAVVHDHVVEAPTA